MFQDYSKITDLKRLQSELDSKLDKSEYKNINAKFVDMHKEVSKLEKDIGKDKMRF